MESPKRVNRRFAAIAISDRTNECFQIRLIIIDDTYNQRYSLFLKAKIDVILINICLKGIEFALKSANTTTYSVRGIRDALLESIQRRFKDIETNVIITSAALLDPRVKDNFFSKSDHRRLATKRLLHELEQLEQSN